MKRSFSISIMAIIVSVTFIWGFSSNPSDRDPNATKGHGNYMESGPVLESPLSNLSESFEGTTFPPAGWSKLNPDGGTGWTRVTAGIAPMPGWTIGVITTPPGGQTACGYVTWNTGGATANDQYLITPQITNVQANDSLSFWLRYVPNSYRDSIEVKISTTTPTAAAFTTLVWRKNFASGSADTNWTQYKFRIGSMVPAGSNIYICWREVVADNLADGASFSLDLVNVTTGAAPPTCNYVWESQNSGSTQALYSVSTVSDQIGWIAGAGSTVLRTTNGGSTWTNVSTSTVVGDVYNIYAWSANDAICTTSPGATFIYKTSNGGANWTQVYTLAGGFINALIMTSATEGYGFGDPVTAKWTIVKTTDGGSTWARMATEPAQVGGEAGWNNSAQIIGNHMWFGTNQTRVYHSTNLGVNWTSSATTGTVNSYALQFNDTSNGLVCGTAVVKTTNGGANYALTTSPSTGAMFGITGAGTDWWAIQSSAQVYRTTNAGTNWTSVYTLTGATLQSINFKVVSGCPVGWAGSSTGGIARMKVSGVGVNPISSEIPESYMLQQNYPNPFNPSTNINFSIPQSGFVTLKVYDMSGREVSTLINEVKSAGSYIVGFNASGLSSGAYFYRLEAGNFVETKKMLLVK